MGAAELARTRREVKEDGWRAHEMPDGSSRGMVRRYLGRQLSSLSQRWRSSRIALWWSSNTVLRTSGERMAVETEKDGEAIGHHGIIARPSTSCHCGRVAQSRLCRYGQLGIYSTAPASRPDISRPSDALSLLSPLPWLSDPTRPVASPRLSAPASRIRPPSCRPTTTPSTQSSMPAASLSLPAAGAASGGPPPSSSQSAYCSPSRVVRR